MQLRNAFYAAKRFGISTLQFGRVHRFFVGNRADEFELEWNTPLGSAPTLLGEFFKLAAFQLEPPRASEIADIYRRLIRPLLTDPIQQLDPRIRKTDLVLHFRAGDVFDQSKRPHANYGQPPLSFYLGVVDREQPERVWIVFEDRSNPCIDAAAAAIRSRGIELSLQSGTLEQDLRLLLSATQLALGRGSFGHMIAHLSSRLQRCYFFQPDLGVTPLRHLGVEVFEARDAMGAYDAKLLRNNWVGSAEQCALMLSYPASMLQFESKPPLNG